MQALEPELSEEEKAVVHRGRNAKSTVPRSASVSEYRLATGFEALCGWLLLTEREERLESIMRQAFELIAEVMAEKNK